MIWNYEHDYPWIVRHEVLLPINCVNNPGGCILGISGWGCTARTLEPLAYTRASFSWILLPYTRVNSPNHSYPRVAVFQKLRSLAQSKFREKWQPILDPNALIYIPYARVNCLKTIPFTAAHTYIAHIWQYPPPPPRVNNKMRETF